MTPRIDLVGMFHLDAAGGRSAPAFGGHYRPLHKVYDNYLTSGTHFYPGTESVSPGESTRVEIMLVTPEIYPGSLWVGRVIEVYEGPRRVGTVRIDEIRTELLRGDPASRATNWMPPPGRTEP
jgi:elongation factor Tu